MGIGQATTILIEGEDGVYREVSEDNPLPTTGTGGGGGAVDSVNGKTGEVEITSEDVEVYVDGAPAGGTVTQSLLSLSTTINTVLTPGLTQLADTKQDNLPDGTNGQVLKWSDGAWNPGADANTTYSVVSQANIENPGNTTSGLVTGQRVAQAIAANATVAAKVGSGNSSVSGIEFYDSVDDLPATGVTGVIYVVPVAG